MSNEYKLAEEICKLSESKIWESAKLEWELNSIYYQSEPETCLCGHSPIKEICILRNKINKNFASVGNVCVNKFIGLPTETMFDSLQKVRKDIAKSFNEQMIDFIFEKKWINEWEKTFYLNNRLKRILTGKQKSKKIGINQKVLLRIIDAKYQSSQ